MADTGEFWFLRRLAKYLWNSSRTLGNPVVFDIGANSGDFCEAVMANAPEARVFAFEPNPIAYARLVQRLPPNVECINSAVGAAVGAISLYDSTSSAGSEHASTVQGVFEAIHRRDANLLQVPLLTIDAFLEQRAISRIDLLKIDVEGAEFEVLKGAMRAIESGKIDVLQLEFNEMNVVSRVFFRDFFELLNGYSFYRLLPTGLLPITHYQPYFCELFGYQNIIAFAPALRSASNRAFGCRIN